MAIEQSAARPALPASTHGDPELDDAQTFVTEPPLGRPGKGRKSAKPKREPKPARAKKDPADRLADRNATILDACEEILHGGREMMSVGILEALKHRKVRVALGPHPADRLSSLLRDDDRFTERPRDNFRLAGRS